VVLESWAAGRPVIASRIAGLEDLVQHEKTGLLFAEESPQELAAAMRRMFTDEPLANSLGRQAQQIVADFAWPVIARRHVELYQNLAGQ
jgi:D-inositol-3-phosphate glycosyltransferase